MNHLFNSGEKFIFAITYHAVKTVIIIYTSIVYFAPILDNISVFCCFFCGNLKNIYINNDNSNNNNMQLEYSTCLWYPDAHIWYEFA
jgi:hypothetical protein